MKETIYSIPINESFEITDGQCPVCRLHLRLTEDALDYTLGPAMMEPDMRQRTNALGFCPEHLAALIHRQKRLPLALILETHIQTLLKSEKHLFSESCYVCDRVSGFLTAYYSNILHLWRTEDSFRQKWDAQPMICRPHTVALAAAAPGELSRKETPVFLASLGQKAAAHMRGLSESLAVFIRSFDHRFAGGDLGEHRQAVQNAAAFLSGPKTNPQAG
ncbi:MAG: DUF6062 family protein [Oscillospiraceae bacterium]|jgi:hypothetical protein|nr:DUF6062 family protein [Oscillospiraceae bacterium]